jgi:uncharacterized Tic20 family protein
MTTTPPEPPGPPSDGDDNRPPAPPSAPGGSSAPPPPPPPPPGDGGYVPPPPPPPAGGYGAPQPGAPAPGAFGSGQLSQQDERMWAMLAHLGAVILGFIAPLVVLLVQGEKSPFTRANAVESLNFQISLLIVGIPLTIITCGLGAVIFLVGIVFEIIGGIKANGGEAYRYPVAIRLVK